MEAATDNSGTEDSEGNCAVNSIIFWYYLLDVFAEEPGKFQCSGLSREQSEALLRAAVGLIAVPVEPDALNAILRLCLRLTRTFHEAALFAELGGIRLLLALTQASSFAGFSSLASLLVRHVLEDEQVRF